MLDYYLQVVQRQVPTARIEYIFVNLCKLTLLSLHQLDTRRPFYLRTKKEYTNSKLIFLKRMAKICPKFTPSSNFSLKPDA